MFQITDCSWRRQCFTFNQDIGWWFIPGIRARIPHDGTYYLLRTNSIGMRSDREYPFTKPKDRKRILLLGDSYTAGDGVSNGERYSDLLEEKHPSLDVLNFGLSNTGTDQQCLIYEKIAKPFEVDAYIFAVLIENIARNAQTCRPSWNHREMQVVYRPKPYFELENDELVLHHHPVPLEKRLEKDLGDWKCPFPWMAEYPKDPFAIYRFADSDLWHLMKRILERFMDQVQGKPVFIMPLPMYHYWLDDFEPVYLDRFKTLEDKSQKRYLIDVLPGFLNLTKEERKRCLLPHDPHYTALAHNVVANAISDQIAGFCPELLSN